MRKYRLWSLGYFLLLTLAMISHLQGEEEQAVQPSFSQIEAPPASPPDLRDPDKKFPFFEEEKKTPLVDEDAFSGAFLNMLGTLALLVCFMFFASYILKRMLATRSQQLNVSSEIKILEQRSLSAKSALYVVQIYDKVFALAENHAGLTVLANLDPQDHNGS